jgi:hypothetical protein
VENNHNLHFDIGTIHLNQVWEAKIRLAVNSSYEAGDYNNINIFGPGASLSFNNGEDTLDLPDTFLTVLPDLNNTGITSAWLEVDLEDPELPADQESFTDTVPLKWTITYNGTSEIHETLAYSNDNYPGRSSGQTRLTTRPQGTPPCWTQEACPPVTTGSGSPPGRMTHPMPGIQQISRFLSGARPAPT